MSKQLVAAGELKKINNELLSQLNEQKLEITSMLLEKEKLEKNLSDIKVNSIYFIVFYILFIICYNIIEYPIYTKLEGFYLYGQGVNCIRIVQ